MRDLGGGLQWSLAAVAVDWRRRNRYAPRTSVRRTSSALSSPFPAGGPTDVAARMRRREAQGAGRPERHRREPRRAGGATGTGYVAQQPGNGCTMLARLRHATPSIRCCCNLPFDTADGVQAGGDDRHLSEHHRGAPVAALQDLRRDGRRRRRRSRTGSPMRPAAPARSAHLSMKLIEQHYGMQLRNVPYRGGAPAAADLVAGHVPLMMGSVQALGKFVQDGKARALVQLGREAPPDAARHADARRDRERHEGLFQRVVDGPVRAVGHAGCDGRALARRDRRAAQRRLGQGADGIDGRASSTPAPRPNSALS